MKLPILTLQSTGIVALLLLTAGATSAEEWTLDRAVTAALAVSRPVATARLEAESAALESEIAANNRLPSFSVTGSAGLVSDVMEISTIPGRTIAFGGHDSYDMALTVHQIVYDGGRLDALREGGDIRRDMSRLEAAAAGLSVEFQTKTAFYRIRAARDMLAASDEARLEADRHLGIVRSRFANGLALAQDTLQAALRVSQAEMAATIQRTELSAALSAFRELLDLPPDAPVEIVGEESYRPYTTEPDPAEAIVTRPEIAALDKAIRAAGTAVRASGAARLPNVSLFGSVNYGKPGLNPPDNEWMDYARCGLTLSWNVWDWGITGREMDRATIQARIIEAQRDELTRMVTRQTVDAAADYQQALAQRDLADLALNVAERRLELVSAANREGTATETDYDIAYSAYTRTLYDRNAARTSVNLAAVRLDYVMGISSTGGRDD